MKRICERVTTLLRMIKFSHSIFALPFGIMTLLIAERGWPRATILVFAVLAMVGARTAAMAFNRLIDANLDADNPRTRLRELPQGKVSRLEVGSLIVGGALLFFVSAWCLNTVALWFSPLVLITLLGYSLTKRWTSWCHFVLGLSLGLSPLGAWVASRGDAFLEQWWIPTLLGAAVLVWTAGFDVIYSCQDYDHDLKSPLHSIPKKLGIRGALLVSSLLHGLTILLLILVGVTAELSLPYYAGVGIVTVLLIWEHGLVKADDLSRVNAAFFTANGLVSLVLCAATALDIMVSAT